MAQKLILFEDILGGAAISSNKDLMVELGKLAEYVFGELDFSIEKAGDKADDIQIWSGDELYKAIANNYCTGFRFKSAFEIQLEGYVGPVMAWFFEPDGAFDDQIVVLTCESKGLFINPRYVCGLLISEFDLERLLGDLGGDQDEDEDDDEDDEDDDEDDEDDDEDEKEDVAKANDSDKGGITLKLMSYSGSVIKMMTVLSGIDGIDEEAAFNILQRLPSVVCEGISAKMAMKIGAILEEAGATVELAKASDSIKEVKRSKPGPQSAPTKLEPKPKKTVVKRETKQRKNVLEEAKRKIMANSDQPYIDLGLSVQWASCNLGASSPLENGKYFSWGEVVAKNRYDWSTYGLCKGDCHKLDKYCTKDSYGKVDNIINLDSRDDAATANLGKKVKPGTKAKLRMPTIEQWQELKKKCTWRWTDINGKNGFLVTGSTGNSIFLPAAGWMKGLECVYIDEAVRYWSSSLNTGTPCYAQSFSDSKNPLLLLGCNDDRCWGFSIRPVFEL